MKRRNLNRGLGHVLVRQNGLGYTWAEEQACPNEVSKGKALVREGDNLAKMAENFRNDLNKFKLGAEQKEHDDLLILINGDGKGTKGLQQRIQDAKLQLEQSKKITEAWRDNPEINYQTYLEIGDPMGLGFFKKLWKGVKSTVASVTTLGQACNNAKKQLDADIKFRDGKTAEYNTAKQAYDSHVKQTGETKKIMQQQVGALNAELNSLTEALKAQESERRNIMMTYEVQKREEEMRLAAEARQREQEAQAAAAEATKSGGKNNMLTYGLVAAALVGVYVLTKKNGKKTVVKAKKVTM